MARFLVLYLIVTGVLAVLALSMPWLVIIGLFFLIVPGLILWVAPTAFLWGAVFSLIWFGLRPMAGDWRAGLVAGLGTVALMWLIPQPDIATGRARLARATLPDVVPSKPLAFTGDVRIDLLSLSQEPYDPEHPKSPRLIGCNGVCAAALFTDGVKSVTIGKSEYLNPPTARGRRFPSRAPEFRTFIRLPHKDCETSVKPTDAEGIGLKYPDNTTKLAEWNLRLSTSDCIASAPTPDRFDLHMIQSAGTLRDQRSGRADWLVDPVRFEQVEIRGRDNAVLLRKRIVRTEVMAAPLSISLGMNFSGGSLYNSDLGWSRTTLSNAPRYATLDPGALLKAHTRLAAGVDKDATTKQARARLQAMIDDPRVKADDSGWATTEIYFEGLEKSLDPQDRLLVPALIRDPRNSRFRGLWAAIKGFGAAGVILRAPLVERLASDPDPAEETRSLGRAIDALPPGIFAVPSAAERALLADPALRVRAPGLVMRQADRGAAAVPELLAILDYHARNPASASPRTTGDPADRVMIDAVRVALCRLGPLGASALPRLAALDASGILPKRLDQDEDWQVTLIRLGRSADTVNKPANMTGTEANFRARQQARAAGDVKFACKSNFV